MNFLCSHSCLAKKEGGGDAALASSVRTYHVLLYVRRLGQKEVAACKPPPAQGRTGKKER